MVVYSGEESMLAEMEQAAMLKQLLTWVNQGLFVVVVGSSVKLHQWLIFYRMSAEVD